MKYKAEYNWSSIDTSYQTASGSNKYGLYDMVGNVWEWCNDWYERNYYTGRPNPDVNPAGPPGPLMWRVFRGGAWNTYAVDCRIAFRGYDWAVYHFLNIGFRAVLDF
ncbi:MAG: SUMF1/EgtB/PvdO family nonheme iron enzyme [Sedimentisphaerales bacterium]|nr:SUMF1/EgtB/PvdO family nonheme iron enzyme [Sedimentisphaerales bacterium]